MKINWKIDYKNKTASCDQLSVSIKEVKEPKIQIINNAKISIGFTKIESKKMYQCIITDISNILWNKNLEDNKLLPNFASQLGDAFSEKMWKKS